LEVTNYHFQSWRLRLESNQGYHFFRAGDVKSYRNASQQIILSTNLNELSRGII